MWQQENVNDLTANSSTLGSENDGKTPGAGKKINASLKALYKQLRPPLISQKLYTDLSSCIVFQMILFLANENVMHYFSLYFIHFVSSRLVCFNRIFCSKTTLSARMLPSPAINWSISNMMYIHILKHVVFSCYAM